MFQGRLVYDMAAEQRAKSYVSSFIIEYNSEFKKQMLKTIDLIIFIQRHFRIIKQLMRSRANALRFSILEVHKLFFVNTLLNKRDDPYFL